MKKIGKEGEENLMWTDLTSKCMFSETFDMV